MHKCPEDTTVSSYGVFIRVDSEEVALSSPNDGRAHTDENGGPIERPDHGFEKGHDEKAEGGERERMVT